MSYKFNPFTGTLDEVGAGGGAATPGGADTQVQFNDGGALGGDAGLVYDKTTDKLTVAGDIDLDDGGTFSTTLQTVTPTANRTVSIPDATGTIGLVNGPTGSIQFNQAGALNGTSDFSTSLVWNNAATTFTGFKLNVTDTASAADSKLLDLQVGGTSVFKVKSSGGISVPLGNKTNAGISFGASDEGFYSISSGFAFSIDTNTPVFAVRYAPPGLNNLSQYWGLGIVSNAFIAWGSQFDATQNHDLAIGRDAANTLAQRNGTNAQTYRLYNTYTNASNYQRTSISDDSTGLIINQEHAGTGAARANLLDLQVGGTSKITAASTAGNSTLSIGAAGTGYLKLTPTTVGALTAAATVGAGTKAFVTDSANTLSSHHGQTVAGGGSNFVPVFSDGTNWIVG